MWSAARFAPLWPLLAFALLSGCVDAPSTTPREVALEPAALGLDAATTPVIADTWWTAYGDPQLDALIGTALAGSPTLAAALARTRQAEAQLSVDPRRHLSAGDRRRAALARTPQRALHRAAAHRRHDAVDRPDPGQPELVARSLRQAGGADRACPCHRPGRGARCRGGAPHALGPRDPGLYLAVAGRSPDRRGARRGAAARRHSRSDRVARARRPRQSGVRAPGRGSAGDGAAGSRARAGRPRHRRAPDRGADRTRRRRLRHQKAAA